MSLNNCKKSSRARRVFFWVGLLWLLSLGPGWQVIFARPLYSGLENGETRWYSIRLGEEMIGYVKETGCRIQRSGRSYWQSSTESKMAINRLGRKVELAVNYEHLETEEGLLKEIWFEQVLASSRVKTRIEVDGDKIKITTVTGSRTFSREIPYSGSLLGPVGIGRLTLERLKNPGDKVAYQTVLAELAQVVSGERTLVGEEEVDCGGTRIPARKVIDRISGLATTREVWLEAEGNEVKAVEPSPFGELVTCLSSEQEVMRGMAVAGGQEQLFQSSLVRANLRLPQARQLEKIVLRLQHKKPEMGWPEIENEYQQVIEKKDDSLVLAINRVPVKAGKPGKLSPEEQKSCLEANAYLDVNDPEITRIAKEVAGREKNVYQKALKLRNWVSRNLSFDLGFVFAPASEVMRAKKATCAGYAALLAALLRASGIPSRYLMGLAYVNGVWGGHAWVEAWLEGGWVPLDAALPSPEAADPARVVIARSSLENGPAESLLAAQRFFGYVTVEVLEFSLKGRTVRVPENQPLYEVKDGRYWNHGLQVGLRVPDGFSPVELDRVWPDKTLLALKGPDGQAVRVTQDGWFPAEKMDRYLVERLEKEVNGGRIVQVEVWGKKRPALVSPEKSALAILNGTDLFVIVAVGPNSEELLGRVAADLKCNLILD